MPQPTQPSTPPTQPSSSPTQPVPQQKQPVPQPRPQPAPEALRYSARHRVPRRAPSRYAVIAFALVVASLTAGSAAFGLAVRSQSQVIGLGHDGQGSISQAERGGAAPDTSGGAAPTTAASPRASAPSATSPGTASPTAVPRTKAPGSATTGGGELTTAALPPTSSLPAAEPLSPQEQAVLNMTNTAREGAGCAPLRIDSRLQAAARAHAVDMVDRHYFSHLSPDGEDPSARAEAAGFPSGAGENIAMGYPTASAVMAGWMASTGHRANILNCSYTVIGVGYDPGTIRAGFAPGSWVQMFGVL
jgi:uncharacterized protein YkwD